jgi:hypothetical protein
MKRMILVLVLVLLVGCAQQAVEVSNFEECIAAGNPAMESYPRQCRHGDRTYTEVIDEPVEVEKPIGGEKDEHGCLPSAGYQWCETTQECQRFWEDPCPEPDEAELEAAEDPSDRAREIAIEYVMGLDTYSDYSGRDILSNNVQVVKCPGCFDVEVQFDRDSVKNPGGVTRVVVHVILKDWEVSDFSASYQEFS